MRQPDERRQPIGPATKSTRRSRQRSEKNPRKEKAKTKMADLTLSTNLGQRLLHCLFDRQATDDSDRRDPI
ncbi:hypothetical protein [uncultured Ralstonia sp.]|jgi:hypothetical protein|uniref:hypothetical protein n=1 Tax=uncultured Ralstonia sp. TaxID=114715 RepID=UPI001EA423B4|nr:hypothetical protein [uncultured Ralstonia sp.]UCF24288.1 MAG: hypothetical protein JSV72_01965 [Ralstonia sp.]